MINSISNFNNNLHFGSSKLNIVSTADNHGDLLNMPQLMKAIQTNKKDLFENESDNSTANMLAIAGDFFMNPNKKGFLTKPECSSGDIQYNFLEKIISVAKNAAGNNNFETVYTPGNHCYDGGDSWLYGKLAKANMTTILTNLNRKFSPLADKLIKENSNIVTEKVLEIADSKNPSKKNKILILGIPVPSMDYYNPGLIKGTKFYDNSNKNDFYLQKKELAKTIKLLKDRTAAFKQENPNGAVILLAHTGNRISRMFADEVPAINLILNGHDHKEFEIMRKNTLILSHGQGSKFIRGIVVDFDDEGRIEEIRTKKIETDKYDVPARRDKKLQKFLSLNIKKDLVPIVRFKNSDGTPEEMVLDDSIRYSNNILANYITSAIKRSLREIYPDISSVGIPSSTFRSGLKSNERRHTLNNLDLMKIFDGVNENLAQVKIGKIKGNELVYLVLENVLNNLHSKTRNPIIQWSDIQVNRTLIKKIRDGENDRNYEPAIKEIKIKNPKTRKFEAIDEDAEYTIALPAKYLKRESHSIRMPALIRDKFTDTGETLDSLFRKYLKMINYKVKITDKTHEKRIL